jgi:hypothetical protein
MTTDGDGEAKNQRPIEVDGPDTERVLVGNHGLGMAHKMGNSWMSRRDRGF